MLRDAASHQYSGHFRPAPTRLLALAVEINIPTQYGADVYERIANSIISWIFSNLKQDQLRPALEEIKAIGRDDKVVWEPIWKTFTVRRYVDDNRITYREMLADASAYMGRGALKNRRSPADSTEAH